MIPYYRLPSVLKRFAEEVGGVAQLAYRINQRNDENHTGCHIHPKTLRRLITRPGSAHLTEANFRAIHEYLKDFQEGLDVRPIFANMNLLENLTSKGRIAFLLGSRPVEGQGRIDLVRWDILGMAHVLTESCRSQAKTEFEIHDVLRVNSPNLQRLAAQKWFGLLERTDINLVSFGTTLGCQATEVLLAKMFNVTPFAQPTTASLLHTPLPFYYLWPPAKVGKFRSAFALPPDAIASIDRKTARAVAHHDASAFLFDTRQKDEEAPQPQWEAALVPARGRMWNMYGVVVAQYRKGGNLWVVASGVSGPATLAAAKLVTTMETEVPMIRGENGPPVWAPFHAVIEAPGSNGQADNRALKSFELVGEPRVWGKTPMPER